MRYRVRHLTACHYDDDIVLAHHLLHLRPRPLATQYVHDYRMDIDPVPGTVTEFTDYFGNPATYIAIEEPHRALVLRTEIDIEVEGGPEPDLAATPPWEEVAERL